MLSRGRQLVAPAYLFLCLILGGSAQGQWANMLLQIIGIVIIAWAAMDETQEPLQSPARQLLGIAILAVAVVALQLIPLPSSLWPVLGGRDVIAGGYAVLGMPVPTAPLSLTPYASIAALLTLIPPFALLCAIVRLRAYSVTGLSLALLGGTIAGILLGALQVTSADPLTSRWYLYEETNFGVATGFFANANHMATLLVITLPFLAALLASGRGANVQRYSALLALVTGAGLVIIVGLVLNGSLAGYVLTLPVVAASALIVMPARSYLRQWTIVLGALMLVGAVGALATSSVRSGPSLSQDASTSVQTRQEILSTTFDAVPHFMPLGSGLGSFSDVYPLYENPDRIIDVYVNHAHNDYAELALETGIPGMIVLVLFLWWWGAAVWRVWRSVEAGPYARAASIASAAILVHSLVDFPLRTAAISVSFAMCLALLADRRAPAAVGKADLRPARHVVMR
ncbi:MAG TPA: O-antigen ligase family protein [Dehalococcoidia bacterium]|nr:O-antigen ligase family protein [Dehalococcoidia bacterium]